jgi:hypothetical protein
MAKSGSMPWKEPSRLDWDLPTSGTYQPAGNYFQKVKKISAVLYIGKGPVFRPFSYAFIAILSRYWVKF